MPRYDFDMFTIGAGSGGVASSRRAGSYGARVAICEESRVGGTCVIRGCVPKKLLVYGAQFADAFADAAGFGWTVPPPSFDWPALIDAKDREIERLSQIYRNMLKNSGVELIEGRGVLVDPHTIEIDGRAYTADKILVATGSHPTVPDIPGIQHVISSNEALDLPALPRRIVIVGGGYIAVEFAGIFNGFGAEVVELIRREELLYGFDDDIRIALAHEMRGRGVEIHARTQVARIEKHDHGYSVYTAIGQEFSADIVMYATGRKPNTRGLGLAEIGVETTENGAVVVDEWSCSNIPNIYAVGDVTDDEQQRDRRRELREADQAEIECAIRQRVHLPANGDGLHLIGESAREPRDPEADERAMRQQRAEIGAQRRQGQGLMAGRDGDARAV